MLYLFFSPNYLSETINTNSDPTATSIGSSSPLSPTAPTSFSQTPRTRARMGAAEVPLASRPVRGLRRGSSVRSASWRPRSSVPDAWRLGHRGRKGRCTGVRFHPKKTFATRLAAAVFSDSKHFAVLPTFRAALAPFFLVLQLLQLWTLAPCLPNDFLSLFYPFGEWG